MDPFLGTLLNNALDDAALLLEVLQAWVYSRRRFGAMSLPVEQQDRFPGERAAKASGMGFDVALKALSILLCDRGQILKNYIKAVRRANRRAVNEVARLMDECEAIGNFGDFSDARRIKLTQLNRAEARVRASAERLSELDSEPGFEDLVRVFVTSVANDCALLPFHTLRVASVMGWRQAWWRKVATGGPDPNPNTLDSVPAELARMVRAGLALRRQQHAALGGSELLSESRAAALIAAVRALLCGAVPVCVHGFLVNMQEIVGRIGGDAAAPRGGAVGAALRIRSGDSWERFHSFVAPDGDREPVISTRRPPSARARSRSRSFDTLESMSGATSRKVGGAWGLARGVTQSLALLPFQVVAARCGIAGPFVGFPDLLDPSPSALAGPDDVRRWLQRRGTAVVLQGQWERSLWRPMMLFPFVRESLLAALDTMRGVGMQLQLQLAPRLRFGWTDRTGSSPLRRFFEGSWSAGLFAGGDACLVNALIGLGATAGLGLGVVLSFPSILTFYSVLDDLRSDGQSAQSRSGILASVWEKALAVTMTDAGRSRLWEHAKTSMYTLPYSLMSLALGRAAVRLLFGGPSKKEWVRFAARRHFLRKFFYTHSEAYRAHNERRGESKLRRMKENVAVSFAPETSAVVNLPRETSGEKRLSSSLKNSSFERRRAEHERKEHLAAQENGSNGSLSPASKAAVTKSPWGEIRPIEELVDEYGGLQGATQNTGEAPVPIFSSNGVVKAPKTSSPRNGDGSHLPILEPNVFRSITDLSAPPEESVDSREDSWASTSSSSTGATRPVAVCSASPVADRLLVSSSPESTTKLSPKLVPIAFSGYEKPVRSANEPSARKRPDPSRLLESFRGGKPNAASVPILYPSASEKKLRDGGSFDEAGPIGLVLSDDELNNIQRKRSLGLTRVRKSPLVEHTE